MKPTRESLCRTLRVDVRALGFLASIAMALLLSAPQAHARSGYLSQWSSHYPASTSESQMTNGCRLCHTSSTSAWNGYGTALDAAIGRATNVSNAVINAAFDTVAGLDSDGDGNSNLVEINANTQPGWRDPAVALSAVYNGSGTQTGTVDPSTIGVNPPYDPAAPQCTTNAQCDDGAYCNGAETCVAGTCQSGSAPCTGPGETCDETNNVCVAPECTTNADCDNGQFCDGTETCVNFTCQAGSNPCAAGETCDEANNVCVAPPQCTVDADCDNGVFCDGTETCAGGNCIVGTNPCTGPGETCDETNNACVPPECTTSADCSDGLFCNGNETCQNFTCQSGTAPCNGPGQTCDETNNVCVAPACTTDADCDDGAFCNGTETCLNFSCQAGTDPCQPGDTCDEAGNVCVPPVVSNPPKNKFNIVMNYELGMHCTGFEFAYCCVLPPYNSILAQVIKTEKTAAKPQLLEADPVNGVDDMGRPTVVRDTELYPVGDPREGEFKKYVLRYWHDAQPRNNGIPGSAPQISTQISLVEGNSLLMWNTQAEGAVVDGSGALIYGTTDGTDNVVQGNHLPDGSPDFGQANDNYWNATWNHLYIYDDLEGNNSTADVSAEIDKFRLGINVIYPEDTGAALHPMGPGVVGAGFGNVLTFSGDTGTVVYTQMKVLENLPVMLTSPRIWEALGLPLTPFEDTINFFGDPGAVDEPTIRPYVQMKAQLHEYDPSAQFGIGPAVLDDQQPVIGLGTAPIDIPNCERCHSLTDGASVNSAQNGKPGVDQKVQEEIAFWTTYYGIQPGESDWYPRLKGAAISILQIHDDQHGTSFMANWPADNGVCSAPAQNAGNACSGNADCSSLNGFVCTSGSKGKLNKACNVDADCGNRKNPGTCEQIANNDGVCDFAVSPQATRLGHGSVMCQRCHADNVIAVVKSANVGQGNIDNGSELTQDDLGFLIPPLTEALHNNHAGNPFSDSLGRDGSCQGCHPAHRSDGSMSGYPITELGLNAYAAGDNRDAAGGCFVGRDVHSNRNKEADGAGTPEHLNAVGQWLQANVASDTGAWKGIWCTNCHSQLGQQLWKNDNWSDPVHNVGTTLRNAASLADIASGLGISPSLAQSWLDPKTGVCSKGRHKGMGCLTDADCEDGAGSCVSRSADGMNNTFAVWAENPGLCDYVDSYLAPATYGPIKPAQDGGVATVEVNTGAPADCTTGTALDANGDGKVNGDDAIVCNAARFYLCGSYDIDGDFNVSLASAAAGIADTVSPFCTTSDCVDTINASGGLGSSLAVPVPMSAATDGRDHWLSAGEPHCADCHAAPYVEQSGNQNPYPPFNYPNKPALFRYSRGHQDITCQGCHESTHGLYPVAGNIDTTSYAQAAGMNTDGSHGPLNCGACHDANANGVIAWADMVEYNGTPIAGNYDAAVSWAHTYTDEASPSTYICQNCHGDFTGSVSETYEPWLVHAQEGRVSRNAMDKVEKEQLGHVSGATAPTTTVCTGCHSYPDGFHPADEVTACSTGWKEHLTLGRVAESVWEEVSGSLAGNTCGW